MAAPTAYRHQGMIGLNRHDGSCVMLTMEEAAAVAALVSSGADARDAVQRHMDARGELLGRRHTSAPAENG